MSRQRFYPTPRGAALERLAEKLIERIASAERPSLLLNRLQAALVRGLDSQHQLKKLFARAPRIGVLLKQILTEAFGHDPDKLLFSPPLRSRRRANGADPGAGGHVAVAQSVPVPGAGSHRAPESG